MNNRCIKIFALVSSAVFVSGCGDIDNLKVPDTSDTIANAGIISQKNFSLLTADVAPPVIDASTGIFTQTDVELTVYIGDRNNQTLTDAHTVYFVPEYGLIEPSCVTEKGSCSVTWSAIKRPDAGGPGSDGFVTITAYTIGEEGFTDTNGNSVFDDDDTDFDDLEEPYVDVDESFNYTPGDTIIDVVSINDPTGANGVHDLADSFFNGPGCTHSSLCGIAQSITIFDDVTMSIVSNTYTIGGTISFISAGQTLIIQNNGFDDLTLDNTDTTFLFPTALADGSSYDVTELTAPAAGTCTIVNESGTVSGADIINVDITCP